jgi:hypothetical protein
MPRLDIDATVLYGWHPHWPTPVRTGPLPGPSPNATRPFWELYDDVTDMIRGCYRQNGWNYEKVLFTEFLIAGFFAEYGEWSRNPKLLNYLVLFNRRSPYRVLQLVGQAYLHMAYDLPRTIANGLTAVPGMPITPAEAKMSYLALEPGFVAVAERSFRKPSRIGIFAIFGLMRFSRTSAAGLFSYWLKAIRSNAFHHAEILINPPPPYTRDALERRLFRAINRAAIGVLRRSWNPLLWLPGLASPALIVLVPLLGLSDAAVRYLLEGLIALIFIYFLLAYRGLKQLIEELGAAVHAAAWNAVGSLRPPKREEEPSQ